MIHAASQAKITTRPLRRNISVVEGSGGNIAVLTGKDGKLLIDSGFAVSKTRVPGGSQQPERGSHNTSD